MLVDWVGRRTLSMTPLEFFESQRLKLLHKDVVVATVAHDRQVLAGSYDLDSYGLCCS
jgi:hypothetical protein